MEEVADAWSECLWSDVVVGEGKGEEERRRGVSHLIPVNPAGQWHLNEGAPVQ